jgi:hypothetical protein
MAWPDMLPEISNAVGTNSNGETFQFVGAYNLNDDTAVLADQGIHSLGIMEPEAWMETVGQSKFMASL